MHELFGHTPFQVLRLNTGAEVRMQHSRKSLRLFCAAVLEDRLILSLTLARHT